MERAAFEAALREGGYDEVADRSMEPNKTNPEHSHPFDAWLLMLGGELTVGCDDAERTYRAGENFTVAGGRLHTERAGPQGARYVAGRRHPARASAG